MKIDQLLKDFWNDKERFADFFNTVMFDSQEMIRSEDLINLPETLTIVIYYGEDPWDGPRNLRDMVDVPEGLETLFNDYRMQLFEVRGNTGETFHNKDIRKILWNAEAIRTKQLEKVDSEFDNELVPYLAAFVNSEKLLDHIERKGGTMCTALNELIEDSRTEGIQQGIQQGEDLFAQLITTLFSLGRTGDAERAASDKEYRKKLMEEFQITQ